MIKLLKKYIYLLDFRDLYYNSIIKGIRPLKNQIIFYGKTNINICKSATIDIVNGNFLFNYFFRFKEPYNGVLEMQEGSKIIIEDNFSIHSGSHIILLKNATLKLGSGYISRHLKIKCFSRIDIGKDVAISENVTIWVSDAHEIEYEGYEKTLPITIGNHVWIGTNVTILKGVSIGDGAIIAAGAVVNKSIPSNCLAAGIPAKVIKQNIKWK